MPNNPATPDDGGEKKSIRICASCDAQGLCTAGSCCPYSHACAGCGWTHAAPLCKSPEPPAVLDALITEYGEQVRAASITGEIGTDWDDSLDHPKINSARASLLTALSHPDRDGESRR